MWKSATGQEDGGEDEHRTQTDLLYDIAEVGAQDDIDVGQGLVDV